MARSDLHNKFLTTVHQSTRFRADDPNKPGRDRPGEGGNRRSSRNYGPSDREIYNINLQEATQQAQRNPERLARDAAYYKTRSQRFTTRDQHGPGVAELDEEATRPRVSRTDIGLIRRAERDSRWPKAKGIYRPEATPWEPKARIKSPGVFISDEMAPSHRQWFEDEMKNPNSEFNRGLDLTKGGSGRFTGGQRERINTYVSALQQGDSHQEALEKVRRSRAKEDVGRPPSKASQTRSNQARQVVQKAKPAGRATKLQSTIPSPGQFRFGIDATSRPTLDNVKKKFPNSSNREAIQIQQAGTEFVSQELLANQKWAHETRRANLLGVRSGRAKENPDKITIFTTNVGHPAVSVPTDSLVGQYIIRKRKSILGGYGVPGSQLRGEFPDAVRDAHIIDVATGASLGIEGRQGVYNSTGFRVGRKASAGYGRPRPLGSHILYDSSSGRPLYDAQGNIKYSEGATRPINWATPNVGFRILIG